MGRFTIVGTFQPTLQCKIGIIYQATEVTHLATMGGLRGQHSDEISLLLFNNGYFYPMCSPIMSLAKNMS
jgi:hypothetical protein